MVNIFGSIGKGFVTALDTLAGAFQNPIVAVTEGLGAARSEFLRTSKAQRVAKTLATTGTLAAGGGLVAGRLALGSAARLAGASLAAPVVTGIFQASPKARRAAKGLADPTTRARIGESIGGLIEDPISKIKRGAKKAAPVVAGAGLVAAGAALAPKIVQKVKERKSISKPAIVGGATPQLVPTPQVIGAVKETPKPKTPIGTKITVSPKINNIVQIQNI